MLFVDVPQLDLGHIFCLELVDAETDHQIGHHFAVLFGIPDDGNGPVDIQQNLPQSQQQMELFLLFAQVKINPAADALHPPGAPLFQQLAYAQHPGRAADEHIEIAAKGVHEGGHLHQLGH